MIIDRLDNRDAALHMPPRVRQALDYLRTTDLKSLPVGRHDLDGDRLFALVQDYTTRPEADCVWEAHRKYIDIQCVVHGVERMGIADLATAREREPYDPSRDVAFFEPGRDSVVVPAGMFVIFWPDDVHAPGGAVDDQAPVAVRKVVVRAAALLD
jgi:YhcH/YjgK/YiaL family protein